MRVTIRGEYFDGTVAYVEHGNVKRSTAKIVHNNLLADLLIKTVRQRGGCWLVNNAQNFQARDFTCILSCLALSVVKIRRHSDDGIGDLFTQLLLGVSL